MSSSKRNSRRSKPGKGHRSPRQFDPRSVFPSASKVDLLTSASPSSGQPSKSDQVDSQDKPSQEVVGDNLTEEGSVEPAQLAYDSTDQAELWANPGNQVGAESLDRSDTLQDRSAESSQINLDHTQDSDPTFYLLNSVTGQKTSIPPLSDAQNITILQRNLWPAKPDSVGPVVQGNVESGDHYEDLSSGGDTVVTAHPTGDAHHDPSSSQPSENPGSENSGSESSGPPDQDRLDDDTAFRIRLEKAVRQRQELEAEVVRLVTAQTYDRSRQAQLEKQVQSLQQSLTDATVELESRHQELSSMSQALQLREQKLELQESSHQQLQRDLVTKDDLIESLQHRLCELEAQALAQSSFEESTLQPLQAENQQFKVLTSDLEAQVAARQKLNERQRREIETLQETLEQQQLAFGQERRQWEHERQDLQASRLEAEDLAQKRVDMLQRYKAELSLARTQITETQAELNELQALYTSQQTAWHEQREHLEARLEGYAETEAETEQRWQEERQVLHQQVDTLNTRLNECQLLVSQQEQNHQNCSHQWETERCTLLQQVEQAQEEAASHVRSYNTLYEAYHHLQTRLSTAEARLPKLQQQVDEYESRLPDFLAAQQQLQQLQRDKAQLEAALSQKHIQIEAHSHSTAELGAEIHALKEKITEQQQHNLRLKAALERTTAREFTGSSVSPKAKSAGANLQTTSKLPLQPVRTTTAVVTKEQDDTPHPQAELLPVTAFTQSHSIHARRAKDQGIDLPRFVRS